MTAVKTPHIHTRPYGPDFVDLDWSVPITEWDTPRLVSMPEGIHRHPVVFVAYDEDVYAIKELPPATARHEFDILRRMSKRSRRTADAVGYVDRPWVARDEEWAGAVITRYVAHAFPYRHLISGIGFGQRREALLDAFAGLLVELHLAGFYWGDCSLSNILYRWDASSIEAVMIDAETSRIYKRISRGQRLEDLDIMETNVAGEMADIASERGASIDDADLALGSDIIDRYHALWNVLTTPLVVSAGDHYRIRRQIDRLHDLGFAVEDMDLEPVDGGTNVRISVKVGGRQYHSEQLRQIAGIDVSENQARAILSDLRYHRSKLGQEGKTRSAAVMKWRASVFEPIVLSITRHLPDHDPHQAYCDYLAFRLALATERDADVDDDEAYEAWKEAGFPSFRQIDDGS